MTPCKGSGAWWCPRSARFLLVPMALLAGKPGGCTCARKTSEFTAQVPSSTGQQRASLQHLGQEGSPLATGGLGLAGATSYPGLVKRPPSKTPARGQPSQSLDCKQLHLLKNPPYKHILTGHTYKEAPPTLGGSLYRSPAETGFLIATSARAILVLRNWWGGKEA